MSEFKKHTPTTIIKAISNNSYESRRNWMLWIFKKAGEKKLVDNPEDYRYSSGRDYAGGKGLLNVAFM